MHRVAFEEPNPEVIAAIAATDEALGSLLSASLAKDPGERPTPEALIKAAEAAEPARAAEAARAAGVPSALAFWPEPLGARVRARQEAYETLHHAPVTGKPAAAPRPAPAESPGESETPARLSRPWSRRKPVLAAAAALAACVVAAVVFVLTRQDAPASAHTPDTGTTSPVEAGPADASPSPEAGGGPSPEGGSGKSATDPSSAPDAVTSPAPDASPTGPPPATDAPAPAPSAPGSPTASPDSPSPDAATPPWISDCTHYSGSGRTRQGDSGKRVLQVQCMLTKRGYGVGDSGVDGTFGSGTETAVRAFQSDKGLGVDGIVGRETWAALRSAE
jgi:negative regulator of sigma E activity